MKVCPECGKVVAYNSYFGAYICSNCNWEDARKGERRNKGIKVIHRSTPMKNSIKPSIKKILVEK